MFNLHQIMPCFVLEMTDVPYSDSDKRGDSGRSDYYGEIAPEERAKLDARLRISMAAHAARVEARDSALLGLLGGLAVAGGLAGLSKAFGGGGRGKGMGDDV